MNKQFNRNMHNATYTSTAAVGGAFVAVAALPLNQRRRIIKNFIFGIFLLISIIPAIASVGVYNQLKYNPYSIPKDEVSYAYLAVVVLMLPLAIMSLMLVRKFYRLITSIFK